jgi:hypothetical protein
MEPIRISFTPTPEDYSGALIAYYKSQRSTWIGISVLGVMFLYGLYLTFTPSSGLPRDPLLTAPLLVAPPVMAIVLFFGVPWSVGRRAGQNKRLMAPSTWELGPGTITIKNKFAETKLKATTFNRITESQTHYLLHYAAKPRLYLIVPKRAFDSPAPEAQFRKWLRQNIIRQRE